MTLLGKIKFFQDFFSNHHFSKPGFKRPKIPKEISDSKPNHYTESWQEIINQGFIVDETTQEEEITRRPAIPQKPKRT